MRTAIFPPRFDQLDAIHEIAAKAARDTGMDDTVLFGVELTMDEACTNLIEHGNYLDNVRSAQVY